MAMQGGVTSSDRSFLSVIDNFDTDFDEPPSSEEPKPCKDVSSSLMKIAQNVESASIQEIANNFKKLALVEKNVDQLKAAATRLKNLEEKDDARKEFESKLLTEKKSIFKTVLSDVKCAMQNSDLKKYSHPRIFQACAVKLSFYSIWATNIESATLAEVSRKLENLTRLRSKINELEAEAGRVQTLVENEISKKEAEGKLLSDKISIFNTVISEVSSELGHPHQFKYFDSESFNSYVNTLKSLQTWAEDINSASLAHVSEKLEELNQLKYNVDQMKAYSAHLETIVEQNVESKIVEIEELAAEVLRFRSLLCEVENAFNDLQYMRYFDSGQYPSIGMSLSYFHNLNERFSSLPSISLLEVSQKMEELIYFKNEVDELKELKKSQAPDNSRLNSSRGLQNCSGQTIYVSQTDGQEDEMASGSKSEMNEKNEKERETDHQASETESGSDPEMNEVNENERETDHQASETESGSDPEINEENENEYETETGQQVSKMASGTIPETKEGNENERETENGQQVSEMASGYNAATNEGRENEHIPNEIQARTTPTSATEQAGDIVHNTREIPTRVRNEDLSETEEQLLMEQFEDADTFPQWLDLVKANLVAICNCEACNMLKFVCCTHRIDAMDKVCKFLDSYTGNLPQCKVEENEA